METGQPFCPRFCRLEVHFQRHVSYNRMITLKKKKPKQTNNKKKWEGLLGAHVVDFLLMIIVFFCFVCIDVCTLVSSLVLGSHADSLPIPFPFASINCPPLPLHLPVCLFHSSRGSGAAVDPCMEHLWSGPTYVIVPFALWLRLAWSSCGASRWGAPSIQRDIYFSTAQR